MPEVTDPDVIEREPAPAPEPEVNTPEPAAAAEEAAEAPEPEPAPAEPEKDRKSPVAQLKGRVGHLTRTLHEKDAQLAERDRQLEAYKAIIEGQGATAPEAAAPAQPRTPQPGTDDYQAAVQAEAARIAEDQAFAADCNKVWDAGTEEFRDSFKESVENLQAVGLMRRDIVEAAIATDGAAKVLHHLGHDLDEAARIAALPPIRMAAEVVKLANRLNAPTPRAAPSNAPAPIAPINGKASPSLDIYDPDLSDEEYYARREKMGAPYVRSSKRAG